MDESQVIMESVIVTADWKPKNANEIYLVLPKDQVLILHAAGVLMDQRTAMARWIRKWISPVAREIKGKHD